MKRILLCLTALFTISIATYGQCPAGMSQGRVDWDNLEFFPSAGLSTYTTLTHSQTQTFALGANRMTLTHNYTGSNAVGEEATHTVETGTYGTGEELQFLGNGSISLSFATAVENLKFTIYDIDYSQTINITAANGASPVNITGSTLAGTFLVIAGNNTSSLTASTTSADFSADNNGTAGSLNIDVTAAVTTIIITVTNTGVKSNGNPKETGAFWLSDITACSSGSFPNNYYAVSQPFTGQPGYVLAVRDNNIYYVDPVTGKARFLFTDPGHTNINSVAYDPVNKLVYYTYSLSGSGGATNPNNKTLRRYDYNMDTLGVVVSDVTTLGIPTLNVGVESGAAAFYNGSLYLGIEASSSGLEAIVWKVDFNGSFAPTTITQQYSTDGPNHDWADFGINNGVLYDFDGKASLEDFYTVNLLTNAVTRYTPAGGVIPRQTAVDWNGTLYNVGPPGAGSQGYIVPYNNTNGVNNLQQYQITYNGVAETGSWGDAAEAFKPKADFGDAPATYDPAGSDPAVHEHDNNLYLGSLPNIEWVKRGASAMADADTDDGLPTVTILKQSGGYQITVTVYNNTGANATLCGWVDYNADGLFTSDEGVSVTVPTSASVQNVDLFWASASTDLPDNSYTMLRLRIASTQYGMSVNNPTGYFYNGEVEDHRVLVDHMPLSSFLLSFNAQKHTGKTVKTDWTIADEYAFTTYELEKSANSRDWNILKTTISQERAVKTKYSFIDEQPFDGINYYRLKITGPNRAVVYSNIKRVDFSETSAITITPNPAAKLAKLYIEHNAEALGELIIVDGAGSRIMQQHLNIKKGANQFDINIDHKYSNGVYQVIVIINNKPYLYKLLVKN